MWFESETAAQQPQVKIGAMHNDRLMSERFRKRREVEIGQWINDVIPAWQGQLQQAKLFPIAMQTVRFRVDGHAFHRLDFWKQLLQLRGFCDHLNPLRSNSAFVLVASRFSINFSIASMGGSAAMVFRNIW